MTQTTVLVDPLAPATRPVDLLMHLVVTLLAPMFLGVSAGNIDHARVAAIETVNAYRARDHADLIAIVQIIAFGLGAVGALSLAMADNISVSMALRLRGNANGLNRSAQQNRRVLTEHRAFAAQATVATPPSADAETSNEPAMLLEVAAAQQLAAEAQARLHDLEAIPAQSPPAPAPIPKTSEERHQEMWAIAMVKEAGDIAASLIHLPPAERKAASIRAGALSSTANQLLTGGDSPPLVPRDRPQSPSVLPLKCPPISGNSRPLKPKG